MAPEYREPEEVPAEEEDPTIDPEAGVEGLDEFLAEVAADEGFEDPSNDEPEA